MLNKIPSPPALLQIAIIFFFLSFPNFWEILVHDSVFR